ncbi:hypothetical protein QUF63_14220 [Anaerolineales bacterium HSG25]|nr:hypothetical protein [Anaerolineales bacterium HSG25]
MIRTEKISVALIQPLFILLALLSLLIITVAITMLSQGYVAETRLTPGTEGQLRQTAIHMSKMLEGESIGGFPGFEPPDNDKNYQRKIKKSEYNGQDVNDWVKEICSYLETIIKKNPNMTLEQILQKVGLSAKETEHFLDSIRNVHSIANGLENHGVNPVTLNRLVKLMERLGVEPWP